MLQFHERETRMKTFNLTTKLGAAICLLALFAAPAGAQNKAGAALGSGFLGDYSKLAPAADNPNARRWISKEFDFKPYDKILLDPVEVWVSPASEYKGAASNG